MLCTRNRCAIATLDLCAECSIVWTPPHLLYSTPHHSPLTPQHTHTAVSHSCWKRCPSNCAMLTTHLPRKRELRAKTATKHSVLVCHTTPHLTNSLYHTTQQYHTLCHVLYIRTKLLNKCHTNVHTNTHTHTHAHTHTHTHTHTHAHTHTRARTHTHTHTHTESSRTITGPHIQFPQILTSMSLTRMAATSMHQKYP